MELNNITTTGTWNQQANALNDNFNKIQLAQDSTQDDLEALREAYEGVTQSQVVVVSNTDWPVSNPKKNTIYRVQKWNGSAVANNAYTDYMWNGSAFILMATYNNAIDNTPQYNSQNIITSGGVYAATLKFTVGSNNYNNY